MSNEIDKTLAFDPGNDNPEEDSGWGGESIKLDWSLEVGKEIGRGAMGSVHRGNLVSGGVVKDVAVKVSNREDDSRGNLRREAAIASQLSNGYIAAVYGYLEHEGRGAVVMEYVDGWDLASIMDRHKKLGLRFPQKFTGAIGWLACEALRYAHNAVVVDESSNAVVGAIHRDISPRNLMVDRLQGNPKIVDFGTGILATDTPEIIGQMGGTLGYVAYEALKGEEIDHRVDIYSLGMVMDSLVRGDNAFLRTVPRGSKPMEAIRVILEAQERGVSPLEDLAGIDPEFAGIVGKATVQNRDRRYGSAEEMLGNLTTYLYEQGEYGPTRPTLKQYLDIAFDPELPRHLRAVREGVEGGTSERFKKRVEEAKSRMSYMVRGGKFCLESLEDEGGYVAID
ncbi:MAG: serine/threonine protein kinase [Nanoarchaeota archaeon]|nr:serine/threonine protein kinase [Nanoarchaeota archaeon]